MAIQPEMPNQIAIPQLNVMNPATYMTTTPPPIDYKLFESPSASFLKGAMTGLDVGQKIAGMPQSIANEHEKGLLAAQTIHNTMLAQQYPDQPSSKAYSSDAQGNPMFQAKNAPMQADLDVDRAAKAAQTDEITNRANLTGEQARHYWDINRDAMDRLSNPGSHPTNFGTSPAQAKARQALGMPSPAPPAGQTSTDVSGYSSSMSPNVQAGGSADTGNAMPPVAGGGGGGGGGNGNAMPAPQATPAPAATTDNQSSNAVSQATPAASPDASAAPQAKQLSNKPAQVVQPAQVPGKSMFTPKDVLAWYGANYGNNVSHALWNPATEQWQLIHNDKQGGSSLVNDQMIMNDVQSPGGKWKPTVDVGSLIKMGQAAHQNKPVPAQAAEVTASQPMAGFVDPDEASNAQPGQQLSSDGPPAPDLGATPASATPQAAATNQTQAAPANAAPAPANPPATNAQAPDTPAPASPQAAATNTPTNINGIPVGAGINENDVPDPDRKLIGTVAGMKHYQSSIGGDYLVRSSNAFQEERVRPSLGGDPRAWETYRVQRPGGIALQQQITNIEKLKQDALSRGDPAAMTNDVGALLQSQHQAYTTPPLKFEGKPADEIKDAYQAIQLGQQVQDDLRHLSPLQISKLGQFGNKWMDQIGSVVGHGVKGNEGVAQLQSHISLLRQQLKGSMDNGTIRMTGGSDAAINSIIGDPAENPTTFGTRLNTAMQYLHSSYATNVVAARQSNMNVPAIYTRQAGASASMAMGQPVAGSSRENPAYPQSKADLDALPSRSYWVDNQGRVCLKK